MIQEPNKIRKYTRIEDEWITPPFIISALGNFDLDSCSPIKRPWDTASNHYTIEDNGLTMPWIGRVWCFPPFGNSTRPWIEKCAEHGNCVALTFANTDTIWFNEIVWQKAKAILFLKGRIRFYDLKGQRAGNSSSPSVLIAFDERNAKSLESSSLPGKLIWLN